MVVINIRKAKKSEFKIIQSLDCDLFLHDRKYDKYLNINWPFEKVGINYIKSKIDGKKSICLVAIDNSNDIVAYLIGEILDKCLYRVISKQAELINIFVKEKYRGQKVGVKLFNKFKIWCKKQEVENIKVRMCAEDLGVAVFYDKLGFSPYASELEYEIKD